MGKRIPKYLQEQSKDKVDWEERYNRIFDFMRRNSGLYHVRREIKFYDYIIERWINSDRLEKEKKIKELSNRREDFKIGEKEALIQQLVLTDRVYNEMKNGIINTMTQGIWLSYPHTTEIKEIKENKDKYVIVHLSTGENFLGYHEYEYYPTINKPHYSKLRLLEKL